MTTLTLGPLAQISRTVRDIKESEAWYGRTLGLPHLYTVGSLAFFDCGGVRLRSSISPSTTSRRRTRRSSQEASRSARRPT